MYKATHTFVGKENWKDKYMMVFVLLPTIGIITRQHNKRMSYSINLLWLFFGYELDLSWEDNK
jgi:hypothetical protein